MIETDHATMSLQGSAKKEVEFEHWNSNERINTHQTICSFRRQIKSSHKLISKEDRAMRTQESTIPKCQIGKDNDKTSWTQNHAKYSVHIR